MAGKMKCKLTGKWTKGKKRTPWLGGFENVMTEPGFFERMFCLYRIPVRGDVKRKTVYFKSWQEAKAKGWRKH